MTKQTIFITETIHRRCDCDSVDI